jgi:hypothetical protein
MEGTPTQGPDPLLSLDAGPQFVALPGMKSEGVIPTHIGIHD